MAPGTGDHTSRADWVKFAVAVAIGVALMLGLLPHLSGPTEYLGVVLYG